MNSNQPVPQKTPIFLFEKLNFIQKLWKIFKFVFWKNILNTFGMDNVKTESTKSPVKKVESEI